MHTLSGYISMSCMNMSLCARPLPANHSVLLGHLKAGKCQSLLWSEFLEMHVVNTVCYWTSQWLCDCLNCLSDTLLQYVSEEFNSIDLSSVVQVLKKNYSSITIFRLRPLDRTETPGEPLKWLWVGMVLSSDTLIEKCIKLIMGIPNVWLVYIVAHIYLYIYINIYTYIYCKWDRTLKTLELLFFSVTIISSSLKNMYVLAYLKQIT